MTLGFSRDVFCDLVFDQKISDDEVLDLSIDSRSTRVGPFL
jgi:hypothetical protein